MKILGLDPGFGTFGYGVIEVFGNKLCHVAHGAIITEKDEPIQSRLKSLYEQIKKIVQSHSPDEVAVEQLFFYKNVTTAIAVGEARGVSLLAVVELDIPIFEYTPHVVKKAVTGSGRASKGDVQKWVTLLLGLKEKPRPDDAADALAIAICHAHRRMFERRFEQ
ncbi:MAG: crossover junction endodeoxyribonuclease RuvC [Pseudothermotoga sp.]|uniref:crossover junction endodeoxyribonuclease RuvC n=1 Tax=Pseudothermotoga sp. TaxID=2033661 RepID=UPI002582C262|nr:crossover junction endodeoxyribonuclease RuvC [Pseudothermotoga sp.]MDI6862085.1 crossover junction endodeoxyribonuclease RuvC [Pseudothermotoga sp.]